MQLRESQFYRTRDGRIAGPITHHTDQGLYPWKGRVEGTTQPGLWADNGRFFSNGNDHSLDLVECVHRAADKAIDQVTLDDYRRGVAALYRA